MPVTLKRFVVGGRTPEDSHKEVYQMTDNGSFFTEDPKAVIMESLWNALDGIPGMPYQKKDISDFIYGNVTSMIFHPDTVTEEGIRPCQTEVFHERGTERINYENTVFVKQDHDGNVEMDVSADFGNYRVTETYVPFHIDKEDACFVCVGSLYRGMKYGDTRMTAVREPFSSGEEALNWLEETRPILEKEFSNYAVEVFSRKHLENTSWYQESNVLFDHYKNVTNQERSKKNENDGSYSELEDRDF